MLYKQVYIYIYIYLFRPKNAWQFFPVFFTFTFWVKTDPVDVFRFLPVYQNTGNVKHL